MDASSDSEEDYIVERWSMTSDRLLCHLQLGCCSTHIAVPWQSNNLRIYNISDLDMPPLLLTGHHGNVSSACFGWGSAPLLLCSASEDYVILWDIERCYRKTREGGIASGVVLGTLLGKVVHLSICPSDRKVAACTRSKIYILRTKKEEVLAVLGAHLGPLTASVFCPWDINILVSISEDRTFKIWNVKNEEPLYQSAVLSGVPLLSVFMMGQSRQLVTGSADGQVWCYTLPDDYQCRLVNKLDLQKEQQKLERNLQGRDEHTAGASGIPLREHRGMVEIVKPILSIWAQGQEFDAGLQDHRESSVWLGSSDGLYLVDLATSELCMRLPITDNPNLSVSMAGTWEASRGKNNSIHWLVTSLFEPRVVLMDVSGPAVVTLCSHLQRALSIQGVLSVIPSSPLMPMSPLNAELKKRDPRPAKQPGVRGLSGAQNKALVFHTHVRSSGYTLPPRRTMFKPKTNIKKKEETSSKTAKCIPGILSDYPCHSSAPNTPHAHQTVSSSATPILCLQYSGDGQQILCGLGDGSALLYKSSLAGTPAVYAGPDKAVSAVCWSHSRHWFLTAAEDRTLSIWPPGGSEPALTMGSEKFSKSIRGAQFYYLDKFLLLTTGSCLQLYLYHLDTARDDIKRYEHRSMVKLTGSFCTSSRTDITASSAVNDFFSYLVLACGADRSIQVFDMNRGCVATQIPDAHSRPIHHITQNQGSVFSTQTQDSYNLFLSSAVTDAVKLWDMRSARCVRRYDNHLNRCHRCSAAISPCGRLIATGSEDHCAYLYDIRSSTFLHKLQRQSNTVLNVAFNPATPEDLEHLSGSFSGTQKLLFDSGDPSVLRHLPAL